MSSFTDFRRSADSAGAAARTALTAAVVRIGGVEIDMRRHEVRRGGETIRLQQQPFQILALLMEHAGGVVTRQDIERRLWPDGTTVDFEHSVNAAIRRLRVALGDDALEPRFVETVPRRGYRFVGRLDPSGRVDERRPVTAARPRVLVRPFVVRGETPDDDGLGPALIEELAAQLAHRGVDRIDVLTRAPEAGDCAARACYRVEGSIRVAGDRVRVLAALIDGRDETHRWGSGFDRDVADVLSLTTDVASAIADAIVARVLPVPSAVSATPVARHVTPSPDAGAAATGWSRREWAMGIVTSGTRWSSSLTR
ncbi:MAG: winged helix-turn-helix domain-containing protein [Vicinamibacteria bacterium]|jgi:DNA-binding winged helix-turn-helix (wHTH) protein